MKHFGLPLLATLIVSIFLLLALSVTMYNSLSPVGKVTSTTVNIYNALPANCDFAIPAGTSQVSFFCIANGIEIDDVLENISFQVLRTYEASSSDKWKVYNPSLPSWVVNDLQLLERTKGYFIETTSNQNFFYAGSLRVPNNIPLSPGWNFVGYPTNEVKDIATSLASISGSYNEVRSYNNTDGIYYIYIPPASGDLTNTEPYRTYWIYATASDTWVVS